MMTVPVKVMDIAPILTLISAFAASSDVRSRTLPPCTQGTIRSRSRTAAQLSSTLLPVEKACSRVTIVLDLPPMDGTYGPHNATLTVHTERAGAAAKAGH